MKVLASPNEYDLINGMLTMLHAQILEDKVVFMKYHLIKYDLPNQSDRMLRPKSSIPFILSLIPVAIAIIVITVFIILNNTIIPFESRMNFFMYMMIPSFICILFAAAVHIKKFFNMMANVRNAAELTRRYNRHE